MKVSVVSNIRFCGNNDEVHKDYIPAGVWAGAVKPDRFEITDKSVVMVDDQGQVTGRYSENRFGHIYGYLIARADFSKSRELILSADEEPNKNILYSVMEKNLTKEKPVEGILVRFEQFTTAMSGTPKTGLTFLDLATGKQQMHITLKGHKMPTLDDVEDYIVMTERNIDECKKHPNHILSLKEVAEKLKKIFEKINPN